MVLPLGSELVTLLGSTSLPIRTTLLGPAHAPVPVPCPLTPPLPRLPPRGSPTLDIVLDPRHPLSFLEARSVPGTLVRAPGPAHLPMYPADSAQMSLFAVTNRHREVQRLAGGHRARTSLSRVCALTCLCHNSNKSPVLSFLGMTYVLFLNHKTCFHR